MKNDVPMKLPQWTFEELQAIDNLFNKASNIEEEAKQHKEKYNYDLSIRRAQEAFEFYIKVILQLITKTYPKDKGGHKLTEDLQKIKKQLETILKKYYLNATDIVRLIIASNVLYQWRIPAFYGYEVNEEVSISSIFTEKEADLALIYVNKARLLCNTVKQYFNNSLSE